MLGRFFFFKYLVDLRNTVLIMTSRIFGITLLMVCFALQAVAQTMPKAVLVQLRSEHKRIAHLQETRQRKKLTELKREAQVVAQVMTNDFRDHFSYCPVYYFYDTNYHLILQNKFDGVLMDARGVPADNIVLSANDTDYWIAYFGPVTSKGSDNNAMGKGLVITDSKGKTINQFWRGEYFDILKPDPRYSYTSKKFDLRYYATAAKLDAKMREAAVK